MATDPYKYGEVRAKMFDENDKAKDLLLEGFDKLAQMADNIHDAKDVAKGFDYIWNLLAQKHQEILEMEKQ